MIGDKTMKVVKKIIIATINIVIFIVSLTIPKSKKIILVGGWFGERFADNSKHFFISTFESKDKLTFDKVVWITRNTEIYNELRKNKFLVFKAWSFKSIWYHFRAKYHVIDQTLTDINPFFSIRSIRINLWHGFPLKNIGIFMKNNCVRKPQYGSRKWIIDKITSKGYWYDYYLLATSEFSANIIGNAFEVNRERIIISGYPRNYIALNEDSNLFIPQNEEIYRERIQAIINEGYKIIGFLPTFRDKRETMIFGTDNIKELEGFLDFCEESKLKIVGKFHFAGKNDKFGEFQTHEAFINLPSDADVYTFLNLFDVLITDYSSIYFDFLLWRKPIIFFPYDLEYYRDQDRGLIFDYEEYTPGPKVFNLDELKLILSSGIESLSSNYKTKYQKQANDLQDKIFGNVEELGIEHLVNKIKKI
ncbi:MAG: hypothetical protein K0R15_772 [Clostridiales bacterium]|jgi:CDP-glycerol glycerophosphotransferase|nr:hypothetical protein [Clostridiales bacterium]